MSIETAVHALPSKVLGFFFRLIVAAVAGIVLTIVSTAAAVILEEFPLKIGSTVLLSQGLWIWRFLHGNRYTTSNLVL